MQLSRLLAMLGLAVAAGIGLIWVEAQNLRLSQKVSELDRRRDWLTERQAQLRLAVNRLAAPARMLESIDTEVPAPTVPQAREPRASLPLYLQR
jgi:hypothetical protein